MKRLTVSLNHKHFLLFMAVFGLFIAQTSNGMMQSKKHQAIARKRAHVAKFNHEQIEKAKGMKDPIWVRTTDGHVVVIEKWKIDQMKVLQVMLVHQKGSNSYENSILKSYSVANEQWIKAQELKLLSDAFDAASEGRFEEFYNNNSDNVRLLINAAQKVEATGLSALCGSYYFPKEMQQLIVQDVVQPMVKYVVCEYIKKNSRVKKNFESGTDSIWQRTLEAVALSPDEKKIVSGYNALTGYLQVWNVQDESRFLIFPGEGSPILSVSFSPDGKKIVSGGYGGKNNLLVWDAENGRQLLNLVGHLDSVSSVSFSPNGKKIVSGSFGDQDNLLVWDAEDGRQLLNLVGYLDGVNSVSFSSDGKKIVSGGYGGKNNLLVWDAEDGRQLLNLVGHLNDVYSVSFSPDGKKIVSGGYGGKNNLLVWDAENGRQLLNLDGFPHGVYSVSFSPDGKYIVSGGSGSNNNHLLIWDAKNGQQLCKLVVDHDNFIHGASISSDGKVIVSNKKTLLLSWDLPSDFINTLENDLTIAQARLLYQMYCAMMSGVGMTLKKNTSEYNIYKTLPELVKKQVCRIFPIMLEECTVEE